MVGERDDKDRNSAADAMTLVCVWCRRIVSMGRGDLAKIHSHGVCDKCAKEINDLIAKNRGRTTD